MPTDIPRFESNERVDLTDFGYAVDDAPQAMIRQLNEQFITDPDGTVKSWILDGFAMSDLGAGQLQVAKGRAILAQREGAEIYYGALTSEGDATKTIDLSGYADDTYNIYIRFQYVDADTQSRIFWNPSGSGSEFAQTIQIHRQANWSLRVELASPGDEWVKIGTVEIVTWVIGGAGIVDQRNMYFEGQVSTYVNTWGGGNDRNADRQQYGVKDLQKFTSAVRQLFEDLRPTGGRWWEVRGLKATGLAASNEPGMDGYGDGSGAGVHGTGGLTGIGVHGVGGATSGAGVKGEGSNGDAVGVSGVGDGIGSGVFGVGGATDDASGVTGNGATSAATNARGVTGTGKGTGYGVKGTGGLTGIGVHGVGGATSGAGVYGVGGVAGAIGVSGLGKGTGAGVVGTGDATANSNGIEGYGYGATGWGAYVVGASGAGGIYGQSASGYGVYASGDPTNPTTAAFSIAPQNAAPTGPNGIGDIYVTTAGVPYICTVAGTPGTWTKISAT